MKPLAIFKDLHTTEGEQVIDLYFYLSNTDNPTGVGIVRMFVDGKIKGKIRHYPITEKFTAKNLEVVALVIAKDGHDFDAAELNFVHDDIVSLLSIFRALKQDIVFFKEANNCVPEEEKVSGEEFEKIEEFLNKRVALIKNLIRHYVQLGEISYTDSVMEIFEDE